MYSISKDGSMISLLKINMMIESNLIHIGTVRMTVPFSLWETDKCMQIHWIYRQ